MSLVTEKASIELRIAKGSPQPAIPSHLKLNQIQVIEAVFQHRSGNRASSEMHLGELMKGLRNNEGKPFDALTVFWIGDAWALIDGHHRYGAYQGTHYKGDIPVKVFSGTLDEAIGEALRGNSRNKLPMGRQEKSNAAWRLVVGTNLSIAKSIDASGCSRQTIATMRKVKDKLLERQSLDRLGELSWLEAMNQFKGLEEDPRTFDEDWIETEAKALADRLVKNLGNNLGRQPEVFWRAIGIYDSRLTDHFLADLGIDPESMEAMEEAEEEF